MNWLITTKITVNLNKLHSKLATFGAEMSDRRPIPLGDDEQVVYVSGPKDLPQKMVGDDSILMISPNSVLVLC